jgi:hypothetical protein
MGYTVWPHGSEALQDVWRERQRQITEERWTPELDDKHDPGLLALAGSCYAREAWSAMTLGTGDTPVAGWAPEDWPFAAAWWKPSGDNRRDLVKAAALILAEIDRLDRTGIGA